MQLIEVQEYSSDKVKAIMLEETIFKYCLQIVSLSWGPWHVELEIQNCLLRKV